MSPGDYDLTQRELRTMILLLSASLGCRDAERVQNDLAAVSEIANGAKARLRGGAKLKAVGQ